MRKIHAPQVSLCAKQDFTSDHRLRKKIQRILLIAANSAQEKLVKEVV
jgi:hypothetical protein